MLTSRFLVVAFLTGFVIQKFGTGSGLNLVGSEYEIILIMEQGDKQDKVSGGPLFLLSSFGPALPFL